MFLFQFMNYQLEKETEECLDRQLYSNLYRTHCFNIANKWYFAAWV